MEVVGVVEAAQRVGLSKSMLNKLRCHGGGPTYLKVGRRVVYAREDLDAWLATKRRAHTSQVLQ